MTEDFRQAVIALLGRHTESTLQARWEDAQSGDQPIEAFWIRETDDLVNVVWLTHKAVIDITLFVERNMTTCSTLLLSSVRGIEVREVEQVGVRQGISVTGNVAVTVYASPERAGLWWVAAPDPSNEQHLRAFARAISDRTV